MELGNYEITGIIGQGGMGTVYKGRHTNCEIAQSMGGVDIKMMNDELSMDKGFRKRFLAEAKTGCAIRHPNIVGIQEVLSNLRIYLVTIP